MWNPTGVDAALMGRLRSHFSEAQIVELGYFVSVTYGQQRWIKTLDIGHGEVAVPTVANREHGAGGAGARGGAAVTTTGSRYAGDRIRKRAPHVWSVYRETRETVLEAGIVERELKDLCARYLAEDPEVLAALNDPQRYDERQRAALAWADAIAGRSKAGADALWRRLHRAFTEPELVELGYSIAITLGQQHWLATHGVLEHP